MMERELETKFQVPERDGRLLCSPRNPIREAQDWLERQKLSSADHRVLIIGFGAGYHVRELQARFPNIKIEIYELDSRFQDSGFRHNLNPQIESYDAVLAFRPCWAGLEARYLDVYLRLTGRDLNPELQFRESADEMKIWQCLRELVR